jgi:CheY-like chemotaxis protein
MKKQPTSVSKPIILVVEDDIDDKDTFNYVFKYRTDCCQLQFVEDGMKAIQLLKSLQDKDLPSLIVLDYNLPGFKGCEVIYELQKIERVKPIPKVIYSTNIDNKSIQSCMKAGAKAYLQKSNTMGGVMHDIDHLLKFIDNLPINS